MLVAYAVLITIFTLKFVLEGLTTVCLSQSNLQQHSLVTGVCLICRKFHLPQFILLRLHCSCYCVLGSVTDPWQYICYENCVQYQARKTLVGLIQPLPQIVHLQGSLMHVALLAHRVQAALIPAQSTQRTHILAACAEHKSQSFTADAGDLQASQAPQKDDIGLCSCHLAGAADGVKMCSPCLAQEHTACVLC